MSSNQHFMPPKPPVPYLLPFLPLDHGIPVGAVMAFAGPLGLVSDTEKKAKNQILLRRSVWEVCDGRELKVMDYQELFDVLGYVYGGNGTSTFKIPDYRGYFLRGVTGSTQNDPDVNERRPPDGGSGGTNNEAGSIQDHALQFHEHVYKSAPAPATPSQQGTAAGAPPSQSSLTEKGPTSNLLLPPGDVKVSKMETRPKNMYVHFIIKCR
jgi:microcystin-dependent protein